MFSGSQKGLMLRCAIRQTFALGLAVLATGSSLEAQTSEPTDTAGAEAAREWIRAHAMPLVTVQAGSGFVDLQPLRRIVGDARIVALGEATHGTREFFQLKHRILEFLVSELGFAIFAIEATLPEAMDVNRYVLTGEGDPARALAGMRFWTWDTEEVLELIHWMRRHNQDPGRTHDVKFYGFDMQYTARAAREVLGYLGRVDPDGAAAHRPLLATLADPFLEQDIGARWPEERKLVALASIRELARRFEERREEYGRRAPGEDGDLANRHLHILQQALEMSVAGRNAGVVRDSAMAANVEWLLARDGTASKAVLWGHNYHVGTSDGAMGSFLRRRFGQDLRVFGFSFDRGEFQARDVMVDGELRVHRVEPAKEGSLDAQLAEAGLELAALDLRNLPETGPVAAWFATTRPVRSIGSGYTEQHPEWYWTTGRVTEVYDALLFVRETTAARANPTGRRTGLAPPWPGARNVSFEEGEPGAWPPGWIAPSGLAALEWDVEVTREDARDGTQAVVVGRAVDSGHGETYGGLHQRIDARPWRGQRITLCAWARIEPLTPATRAYLWLEVTHPDGRWSAPVFFENMAERPVTSREWRQYAIVTDVPEDADVISFGFAVVGEGRAWLDGMSLAGPCASVGPFRSRVDAPASRPARHPTPRAAWSSPALRRGLRPASRRGR